MASHVSTRYRIILREENLQSLATYKIVQMKENGNEIVVPCRCCLMNTSNSNEEYGRICSIHLILNLQYYPVKLKHAKSLFLHYRYPAINKPAGVVHWTSRRDILLEYMKNVQPEFMELFVKRAPQQDAPDYAPGTQKKVTGEVIRWNNVSGPEKIDAIKYIELLEAEVEELNRQVERISANGSNELLDYLKSLEPQNLKDLTSSAGEDVVVAMNTFIKRLLAVSDPSQMKTSVTETSAPELAKLLYWLMVVGYSIRNIEVRFDMERVLGGPPKRQELPPPENI
ncbi:hypothetical protein L2E82_36365 [Cichorium intybus]|uniref:Uncharacterized protein n=1 Tax=Cichorium intybus TaxID=13427 RepID=A0ACB9BRQ1_CICIN|nr:hypothetical protein L2E82_36365 [Cichorium intybus]